MKKSTLILAFVVLVLGVSFAGVLIFKNKEPKAPLPEPCPDDVMMCPDGSSVPRLLPDCAFGICKQEESPYKEPVTEPATSTEKKEVDTTSQPSRISSLRKAIVEIFTKEESQNNDEVVPPTPQTPPSQNKPVNEITYSVQNNQIVSQNNTTIYTIPQTQGSGSVPDTWQTKPVNVIPIGNVPPVIGAIPIQGTEGRFYLSENSFGNIENCEFSNRIYILDTVAKTKILMYEENSGTLSSDDPRACTREIFLLATEDAKLIIKYHTIGTNMICESTWSEPEKTWYLNVTKLEEKSKRYYIAPELYTKAEEEEEKCRENYQDTASSTETGVNG